MTIAVSRYRASLPIGFISIVFSSGIVASGCDGDEVNGELQCGPGTFVDAGQCVSEGDEDASVDAALLPADSSIGDTSPAVIDSALPCGPGTLEDPVSKVCLRVDAESSSYYAVRAASIGLKANGYATIPIFGVGVLADGTPSEEEVVFGLFPPGRGTVFPSTSKLTKLGQTDSILVACNGVLSPSCLGNVVITMARASEPAKVVATSSVVALFAPAPVASLANCPPGAPRFWIESDPGQPFSGTETLTTYASLLQKDLAPSSGLAAGIEFRAQVAPNAIWYVTMGTGTSLAALQRTVYDETTYYATKSPEFEAHRGSVSCSNGSTGRFQVHELTYLTGGGVKEMAATFEQQCVKTPTATTRGCFRYVYQ